MHMHWTSADVGAAAVVATALCGALWFIWQRISPLLRFGFRLARDWEGEPARDGVPERPGVMKRLQNLDARLTVVEERTTETAEHSAATAEQMRPNGGSSVYDKVTKVAEVVTQPPGPAIHIHTEGNQS